MKIYALAALLLLPLSAYSSDAAAPTMASQCATLAKDEAAVSAMTVQERNAMLDAIAACYERADAAKREADARAPKEQKGAHLWD